jgi:hypothetical protein
MTGTEEKLKEDKNMASLVENGESAREKTKKKDALALKTCKILSAVVLYW